MKKIILIIFILSFGNVFSQTKKDYSEIIKLVITEYETDTIKVYKRFLNHRLISELDIAKSKHDHKIHQKYEKLKDSVHSHKYFNQKMAALYDDSVIVEIEKIKAKFFSNLKLIKKKDNNRIKIYHKTDFKNNRKKRPIAYISFPLISFDNKKAIVFGAYICGGLCGSGGVFYLEKNNGKWEIVDYNMRWVS